MIVLRRHRVGMRFRAFPDAPPDTIDDDWSPLLPTQVPDHNRWRGEHMMLLAVLADALHLATTEISHSCRDRHCPHTYARDDAKRWIMSGSERPYGFLWTCEHLGSNPEAIRRKVRNYEQRLAELPLFAFATGTLCERRSG